MGIISINQSAISMNDIFKTIKIHTAGTGDFTGIKNCAFSIESNDHLLFPALKRRRKPIVFIPFFCTVFTLFKNKIHPENPVHSNVLQYFFRGNFKSLQKWQKILVAICKWCVFGGYPVGSHAQTTISNSSTIFFQPNFAGLLKLPQ